MQPSNGLIEIDEPPPAFVSMQKHSEPRHSRQSSQITFDICSTQGCRAARARQVKPSRRHQYERNKIAMGLSAVVVGDTNLPTGWASS